MSYNILASCYSDTDEAKEELFTHCPLDYLDFKYRRILLLHEIKSNSNLIKKYERDHAFDVFASII